jgi:hypothetical protein
MKTLSAILKFLGVWVLLPIAFVIIYLMYEFDQITGTNAMLFIGGSIVVSGFVYALVQMFSKKI